MPTISDPFVLNDLPHTSKELSLVKASSLSSPSSVVLGISNSAITSYSLLPTPRLLWTHSIPPSSSITALETTKLENDTILVAYGVYERKKYLVKLVNVENNETHVVKSFTVGDEVTDIIFSKSGEEIYIILKNSMVQCYSIEESIDSTVNGNDSNSKASLDRTTNNDISPLWSSTIKHNRSLVFTSFIPPADNGPEDGCVVLVAVGKKPIIEIKVLGIEKRGSYDLVYKEIEMPESEFTSGALAYNDGSLYRYKGEEGKVYAYSILNNTNSNPNNALILHNKVFSVPVDLHTSNDIADKDSSTPSSPTLIATNSSLFLSQGNFICLFDKKYNTIISQKILNEPALLIKFIESSSTLIGISSLKSSSASNSSHSIVGINVDFGKGTLLESLGKGFAEDEDPWRLSFVNIFPGGEDIGIYDALMASQALSMTILETLSEYKENEDINSFEYKAIKYLKGTEWEEIPEDQQINEDEVFAYEDKDRDVDREFIFELVDLIFENTHITDSDGGDEGDSTPILELNSQFVPQKLIIYLLTHPLFPTPELPGLFDGLSNHPRLLRQAIVTAPGVECFDLIDALSISDNEIFRDTVNRISEEFGQEEIFESIKLKYGQDDNNKQAIKIVNKLIELDIGWQLIPSFIDIGGLFGWNNEVVSHLYKSVSSQVEALESSAEIMTLINETLRKFDDQINNEEKQKKFQKQKSYSKGPELISSEQREKERMKNLLKFGLDENTTTIDLYAKRGRGREGNIISRKVPLYSVEKLVL